MPRLPHPIPETESKVAQRFMRYVQIETTSDPESKTVPSTEKQKNLGRLLKEELIKIGLEDVFMDEFGYVFATLPSTIANAEKSPVLCLMAHVDTSPDESGKDVKPVLHRNYQGGKVEFGGKTILDPATEKNIGRHIGHDIITSDGTTLLGSDDKAGVAIIMQLAEDLLMDKTPRPKIRICFTVDEEIGRGVDALDLDFLGADVGYTLDGSDNNTFSAETFNAAVTTIKTAGTMVHPGYAKGILVNAARILADIIASIPANEAPDTTSDREGYYYPYQIAASDTHNGSVKVLLRDHSPAGMEKRKQFLLDLVDQFKVKNPKATVSIEIEDQYKNMLSYIKEKDDRVITFAQIAAEKMGFELHMEAVRGGTDGARLSELGLPTPNIFTGGFQFHSCKEWNTVQNLEKALEYTKQVVFVWGEKGC